MKIINLMDMLHALHIDNWKSNHILGKKKFHDLTFDPWMAQILR